jgi:hypothetical protein
MIQKWSRIRVPVDKQDWHKQLIFTIFCRHALLSPRSFFAALFFRRALFSPRSYVAVLLCRTLFCRALFLWRAFVAKPCGMCIHIILRWAYGHNLHVSLKKPVFLLLSVFLNARFIYLFFKFAFGNIYLSALYTM